MFIRSQVFPSQIETTMAYLKFRSRSWSFARKTDPNDPLREAAATHTAWRP
jgi:hypothetical protein